MKKEIIEKKNGVYQITTTDERWYTISNIEKETGLPFYQFVPSVTWITSYVYKGIEFYKWLANKGWDEAEIIKTEAGDKGSKIHNAINLLIKGEVIKMSDKFNNLSDEKSEDLSPDEYSAVNSFVNWYNEIKPTFILNETEVISKKYNFAGTLDCVAKIEDQIWIIDWKSSQYIWPSMKAQISAYKRALSEMGKNIPGVKLAILQVGYKKNKRHWKFTEVEDEFESLFLPAQKFWESATKGQTPKQYQLPLQLTLNLKKDEVLEKNKNNKKNENLGRNKKEDFNILDESIGKEKTIKTKQIKKRKNKKKYKKYKK